MSISLSIVAPLFAQISVFVRPFVLILFKIELPINRVFLGLMFGVEHAGLINYMTMNSTFHRGQSGLILER
jgi:hypothetical protein